MIIEFLSNWWGIVSVLVFAVIFYSVYGYDRLKKDVVKLIFTAEEQARERALETGEKKFEWVANKGYKLLPSQIRFFISQDLFRKFVQATFDQLKKWALQQE